MTVSSSTNRTSVYVGDDVTTDFAVGFYFLEDAHLLVTQKDDSGVETTLTLSTEYTVVGSGVEAGGTVTLLTALPTDYSLVVTRNMDFKQEVSLGSGSNLPSATLEQAYDRLTMQAQQLLEALDRTVQVALTDEGVSTSLPTAQADYVLAFNSTGDALTAIAPELSSAAAAAASATAASGSATAAAASAASLGFPSVSAADEESQLEVDSSGDFQKITLKETIIRHELLTNLFI